MNFSGEESEIVSAKRPSSHIWWLVLILLIAASLRIYGVASISPPGLEHDEVANWLIDRAILEGQHAIYFSQAYGHEAGFHYLQAISIALLGDHALAIRLPATFAGLLLIAIQYALTRRLFGYRVALWSAAFLAVLFWPVFYSRLGLRAILLPFMSGLALYVWWKAWQMVPTAPGPGRPGARAIFWFGLSGFLAGLTLYTYMAARAVPIFFAIFLVYLAIFHWAAFKSRWKGILLFVVLLILVAAPLFLYLQANPGAEFRVTEIDAPLKALLAGDLEPVLENSIKILGMFGFSGDPLWRQNVAGRPVFGPVLALLFYFGLLVALWRWRDARYAYLLLWLGTSAVPSVVTVDAPSSIRMVNALLVVTIFPALFIHIIPKLSTKIGRYSTGVAYLLGLLLLITHIWWTGIGVFHTWPENDEVQFVWQAALTDTAAYLDQAQERDPTAIGGWSPSTMDPVTIALSMHSRDLNLRYFGSDSTAAPLTTIIIPHVEQGNSSRITRPSIRDFAPELENVLQEWGAAVHDFGSFVLYEISEEQVASPPRALETIFGDELKLLGFDSDRGCAAGRCRLLTYWQVLESPAEGRRFFLHAVDQTGNLIGQFDGLDAPATYWQQGDYLIQHHALAYEGQEPVELRLGVYQPDSGRRLLAQDGQDHIIVPLP